MEGLGSAHLTCKGPLTPSTDLAFIELTLDYFKKALVCLLLLYLLYDKGKLQLRFSLYIYISLQVYSE